MQHSSWLSLQLISSLFMIAFFLINAGHCVPNSQNNCAVYIAQYEKRHNIPAGLLQAISKIESGRKDGAGQLVAWPWTINAQGQGYYFPTKEAAIEAVRRLQAKGIKSIDVGCMQINLHHHPSAFVSLQEAFEPADNVAYGASYLSQLNKTHASWFTAVSHYHSANPIHHVSYQKNVLKQWGREMKGAGVMMAAVLHSVPLKVNRIRRLPTTHKAKFEKEERPSQGTVRRVTRFSSRLKRLSS
jgi:hypothetical protein